MTSALTIELSKHSFMHIFSSLNDILIIEKILRRHNVYDTLGYSEDISCQVKMMINNFPIIKGK